MRQRVIITIGGGKLAQGETRAIEREIVRHARKRSPRLLFIPTASSDDESYWQSVNKRFRPLGCRTDVLMLLRDKPKREEIEAKIRNADIVYVGGGNTLKMMRLWRRLGVDELLRAAYRRGAVMCGTSAGSICWYEAGHSDSMAYYNPASWQYIKVRGLELLPGIHCPHYDSHTLQVPRRVDFQRMLSKTGGLGIAIENCCALEYVDGRLNRIISSRKGARAYLVYKHRGTIIERQIDSSMFGRKLKMPHRHADPTPARRVSGAGKTKRKPAAKRT
ncbi:MAG: peptidase E [Bdellovibrionota bacterium]